MIITGNVGWGICARGEGSRPWESGGGEGECIYRGLEGLDPGNLLNTREKPPKLAALKQLCGFPLNADSQGLSPSKPL